MVLCLFLTAGVTAQSGRAGRICAAGAVVDNRKHPIANPLGCFESQLIGDLASCGQGSREGMFLVCSPMLGEYAWFVVQVRVEGMPRTVVNEHDLRQFPEFRGLKLKVPKDPDFIYQLEYIRPHIVYKKVEIDLAKLFAGDLVKGDYDLRYDLFYKGKVVRRGGYVDGRDFDSKTKKLTWAIPVGKWTATFKLNNGKNIRRQKIALSVK